MARNDIPDETTTSKDKTDDDKPKTRAGLPLTEKAPMTIAFSVNSAGDSVGET